MDGINYPQMVALLFGFPHYSRCLEYTQYLIYLFNMVIFYSKLLVYQRV